MSARLTGWDVLYQVSEHIERLVQLLKGDEPNHALPEGEDIATLEVDEKEMEVNKPTYFAPVTGVGAALAQASNQSVRVEMEEGKKMDVDEDDEDDRIEEI